MKLPRAIGIRAEMPCDTSASLRLDFDRWIQHRRANDRDSTHGLLDHHRRQLDLLETIFHDGLDRLDLAMKTGLEQEKPTLDVACDRCRAYVTAGADLRRLWEFFKARFDQRDLTKELREFLKVADEVVWSCYVRPFAALAKPNEAPLPPRPMPLPYLESRYSPSLLIADQTMPRSLRLDSSLDHLEGFLQTLPISFVCVPEWCTRAPWWLIFMAHEVGHQVQRDLNWEQLFRDGVKEAAGKTLAAPDADAWGQWADEIFADLYSVHIAGPWAVRALAEVVRASPAKMATRGARYPAPAIRLALMECACKKLLAPAVVGAGAPSGLNLKEKAQASAEGKRDWEIVDAIVDFGLSAVGAGPWSLAQLTGWNPEDFKPRGAVETWARDLAQPGAIKIGKAVTPRTAGHIVCGALRAWAKIIDAENDDADWRPRLASLAANTRSALLQCVRPGARPATKVIDVAGKGSALIDELLEHAAQT